MKLREPSVAERRRFKAGEGSGTIEAALRAEMSLVEEISEWHRAALLRLPISKFAEAADYVTGFYTWPANWDRLPGELSQFFTGWSRSETEGLTGTDLWRYVEEAGRISEQRQRDAKRNGQQRR